MKRRWMLYRFLWYLSLPLLHISYRYSTGFYFGFVQFFYTFHVSCRILYRFLYALRSVLFIVCSFYTFCIGFHAFYIGFLIKLIQLCMMYTDSCSFNTLLTGFCALYTSGYMCCIRFYMFYNGLYKLDMACYKFYIGCDKCLHYILTVSYCFRLLLIFCRCHRDTYEDYLGKTEQGHLRQSKENLGKLQTT